jgi:hypothetical protein
VCQSRIFFILAVVSVAALTQETQKPRVSNNSLTSEQIEVYRAVLSDYLKGSDGTLNLANLTVPMEDPHEGCFDQMGSRSTGGQISTIHRLDPSLVSDTKIVLVDPERQQAAVKGNDPQKLIKKAIDDHERVTGEQVDDSVKQAFQTGLFTLSEIVFDKDHRHAKVAYSFVCGTLCGNGNTLILKKVGRAWKVTKRCGGWVS